MFKKRARAGVLVLLVSWFTFAGFGLASQTNCARNSTNDAFGIYKFGRTQARTDQGRL